jgi:pimeloyl-ACP methyl ester carboxylesterase
VGGVKTRCLFAGDERAEPLILIHGQSMTADIWNRNIDALGRDFRVVAIDMLGHGFTRPPAGRERVTIPEKIAHLGTLADTLGFRRYALSGSSYGALLAAQLYLAAPARVSKLVINGSGSCFNTQEQLIPYVQRLYDSYWPTLTTSSPDMWRERITGSYFDPALIAPELPYILALCYAQPGIAESWQQSIETMLDPADFGRFRILDRLEEFRVETLVVWGRQDKGGVIESAEAAIGRMPKAKLVAFDRCGHMPMVEHAAEYNALVCDFLRGGAT